MKLAQKKHCRCTGGEGKVEMEGLAWAAWEWKAVKGDTAL